MIVPLRINNMAMWFTCGSSYPMVIKLSLLIRNVTVDLLVTSTELAYSYYAKTLATYKHVIKNQGIIKFD